MLRSGEMIEIKEMQDDCIMSACPLDDDPPEELLASTEEAEEEDEYPGCGERAREIRRRFFREVRDMYGNCVLYAWDEGKIVGFTMFLPKPVARKVGVPGHPEPDKERAGRTLVLLCTNVAPSYRGKGVGTKLVNALIVWAKDNGWIGIEGLPPWKGIGSPS